MIWLIAWCLLAVNIGIFLLGIRDLIRRQPVGTRSVLYGAHAFWLHPFFVAWGWKRLYGFPWDPRLWVAFFVHDLGYWGMPNMDVPEGERHPEWGAHLMTALFDRSTRSRGRETNLGRWGRFTLYHSRFYSKAAGERPSRLCFADKLAICLTPAWLYLPMVRATGEIHEYRQVAHARKEAGEQLEEGTLGELEEEWYAAVQRYMARWVEEHKDGREDSWTPDMRKAEDETGVWS